MFVFLTFLSCLPQCETLGHEADALFPSGGVTIAGCALERAPIFLQLKKTHRSKLPNHSLASSNNSAKLQSLRHQRENRFDIHKRKVVARLALGAHDATASTSPSASAVFPMGGNRYVNRTSESLLHNKSLEKGLQPRSSVARVKVDAYRQGRGVVFASSDLHGLSDLAALNGRSVPSNSPKPLVHTVSGRLAAHRVLTGIKKPVNRASDISMKISSLPGYLQPVAKKFTSDWRKEWGPWATGPSAIGMHVGRWSWSDCAFGVLVLFFTLFFLLLLVSAIMVVLCLCRECAVLCCPFITGSSSESPRDIVGSDVSRSPVDEVARCSVVGSHVGDSAAPRGWRAGDSEATPGKSAVLIAKEKELAEATTSHQTALDELRATVNAHQSSLGRVGAPGFAMDTKTKELRSTIARLQAAMSAKHDEIESLRRQNRADIQAWEDPA